MAKPSVYNIPATQSFVDVLAKGLLRNYEVDALSFSRTLILLPTRRACRTLQDTFLKHRDGKPLLLPRLCPIADIDEEELFISARGNDVAAIPPAMSTLQRQIILAKTIGAMPDYQSTPDQNMALAKLLGQLMDQIYTENLDMADLPKLVDIDELQEHWQITVKFLEILSTAWPEILAEKNMIDAADRRNRLINALRQHWQGNSPDFPVIAAGSTGSIPATTELLKVIASLDQGSVILPALDKAMSDNNWEAVEEGHPQATLKHLLKQMGVKRSEVENWSDDKNELEHYKTKFISKLMLPAEHTDQWQCHKPNEKDKIQLEQSLKGIQLYECDTANDESLLVALILREVLQEDGKTAALITADRNLARRVAMACKRWGIDIDDSAGVALSDTSLGSYLRLCALTCQCHIKPVSYMALLKHSLCRGSGFFDFRKTVRLMEQELLRGLTPQSGFDGIVQRIYEREENYKKHNRIPPDFTPVIDLNEHMKKIFMPFLCMMTEGYHRFSDLLIEHIRLVETLAGDEQQSGDKILWAGDEGEAAAQFLSELRDHVHQIPDVTGQQYLDILEQLLSTVTVRSRFGMHPRLSILGQLEARLIQADRVIMAGLNEGSWPPDPGHDPWMSRAMRKSFGLPLPERGIGLSAHDFVQGLSASEVFVTRAKRVDGTPAVPARWLQRLDALMDTWGIQKSIIRQGQHLKYKEFLEEAEKPDPVKRPQPCPPVAVRPRKLSVTRIEQWLKDPYSIYAQYILGLKKLDPLEKQPEALERGNLLHDILEKFVTKYPRDLPQNGVYEFITISKQTLIEGNYDPAAWSFWQSRMARIATWFIDKEKDWRAQAVVKKLESKGEIVFTPERDKIDQEFTLTARADRIDKKHTGGAVIIDYKSGGKFTKKGLETGKTPQLPLEALILERGGFKGVNESEVSELAYWALTGGSTEGSITALENPQDSIKKADQGLTNLIRIFDNSDTVYYSIPNLDNTPRFNDYEHLARVKEWTALGDESTGEAA